VGTKKIVLFTSPVVAAEKKCPPTPTLRGVRPVLLTVDLFVCKSCGQAWLHVLPVCAVLISPPFRSLKKMASRCLTNRNNDWLSYALICVTESQVKLTRWLSSVGFWIGWAMTFVSLFLRWNGSFLLVSRLSHLLMERLSLKTLNPVLCLCLPGKLVCSSLLAGWVVCYWRGSALR
jgi:hypothetical protein